jgi:RNA polymerase sigma factor (TIGR02999 family)
MIDFRRKNSGIIARCHGLNIATLTFGDISARDGGIEVVMESGQVPPGTACPLDQPALFALVYDELHRLARRERRAQHEAVTLNTTALVHETYLKLRDRIDPDSSRGQFLALAARAMRQILVDYARRRGARKRGGDFVWTGMRDEFPSTDRSLPDVIALDCALDALERLDPDLVALVECHVFGGLAMEDVAALRGVATRTAFRSWRRARAFLLEQMAVAPRAE